MNQCEQDSDCTAKPYGTCEGTGQIAMCACRYGCVTDDDCGAGALCACYGDSGSCLRATCRTDADCTVGFQCRAFQDPATPICGSMRFECQTPADTCQDDSDCNAQYCVADSAGVHQCRAFSCGVPGRPFLIDGCAVVAPVVERGDWLDGSVLRSAESLPAGIKLQLTAHYTQAAQLEHASIAAFARFALQLLELAAPAELVNAAQQAMAEELAHTTACFALASRFAQRPLGPGALQVTGCLERTQLADVVRLAVREGCIGETVAAVQAGEALAHASDAGVRRVLETIQRDETRHAELAFRFVRWALTQDASLRAVVLEELAQSRRHDAQPAPQALTAEDALCTAYGVLPAAHLADLERRVIDQVVSALLCELVEEERAAA